MELSNNLLTKLVTTLFALGVWAQSLHADSTRSQRDALFEYLLVKTLERTAFSPEKPATLGLAPGVTMADHVRAPNG